MEKDEFYKYQEENDIHFLDYTGSISLNEGIQRIGFMEKLFFKNRGRNECLRILMDARGYKKESPEIHDELAKISHKKFDQEMADICKYMAVLNDDYNFQKNEFEKWFTDEEAAITWLKLKT